MHDVILLSEAKDELRREAIYSKKQWGKRHGKKYINALQSRIRELGRNPYLYPLREDILPGIRLFNHKGNCVIYTVAEDKKQVIILSVLSHYQKIERAKLQHRTRNT